MNDRRVVITGMGVVTPLGNDLVTFWENLKNGVSGIGILDAFDTTGYDCRIAGQVRNFEPKNFFNNPKDVRRTDRYAQLAMAAAKMAKEDCGIDLEKTNRQRFGAIVSSGIGGLKTLEDQHTNLMMKGPDRLSPLPSRC
jgi:3-oxoacyl-[acyl-carrier-protein] synthase II